METRIFLFIVHTQYTSGINKMNIQLFYWFIRKKELKGGFSGCRGLKKTHGLGYLVYVSGEFDEDLLKRRFSYMLYISYVHER